MKYDYVIIQDNQVVVEGKNADDLELIEELENLGIDLAEVKQLVEKKVRTEKEINRNVCKNRKYGSLRLS